MSDAAGSDAPTHAPHPFVWTVLYVPFGAVGGFITIALTFLASKHGLSITEGALLNGAQMLTQWLKWLWAPAVDVTLTPKKWYVISTAASAIGIAAMASVPLGPSTLGILLAIIAAVSVINSNVGMAVEALISKATSPKDAGRVGAWFQAGNLGGTGLGGALGLFLVIHLPKPWMAGAIMGMLLMACCAALGFAPDVDAQHRGGGAFAAVGGVVKDLRSMLKTKGGVLSALLCLLPVGTGAASGVLTQAKVAAHWAAGEHEVELMQGLVAGLVQTVGCFAGGWLCQKFKPRTAYAGVGLLLAVIAAAIAVAPPTVSAYVVGSFVYAFGVGLAYSSFSAVVLDAMGEGSGATKYNVFASLANFPIWWLGLLLGYAADKLGPANMLLTEAALGVVGIAIFAAAAKRVAHSRLRDA
jgi:MFS family permease